MADVNLQMILFAAAGGVIPTFIWLWFWLTRQDDEPEPPALLLMTFFAGALGVLILLPMKPFVEAFNLSPRDVTIVYAALEELIKVAIVALIAFGSSALDQAIDYTIYLITGALGFSALENTLYLLGPLRDGGDLGTIVITGNLRFLGATVLHTVTVALVGVLLGLAFSSGKFTKLICTIIGMGLGIGLHTGFNHYIMQNTRQGTITAIAGIWFVAVIIILLFDRLRSYHSKI